MRSDLVSIDQLLMCMSKPQPGDRYPLPASADMKTEPNMVSSSDSSLASYDDNDIIEFGPIKVKPRKRPAPTLATGRRSKYEVLTAEEEHKRHVRRARNRAAAERVRISRLAIEQQLQDQIDRLEQQSEILSSEVQTLQNQKLHLETRVFTHQQMCSNVDTSNNVGNASETDLTSYFSMDNTGMTFQLYDRTSDLDLNDPFLDSLIDEHIDSNPAQAFSASLFSGDLDDLFLQS